jgi:peptidyl-prolyl cis-trans isomerase C
MLSRLIFRAAILFLAGLGAVQAGPDPANIAVAERSGVVVTLAEVDAQVMALPKHLRAGFLDNPRRIEELVERMLLDKELAAWARARGADNEEHFELLRQQAEAEALAKRARALNEDDIQANMPDFGVLAQEIFLAAPHRFRTPPSLTLEHILVSTEVHGEAVARERVEAARAALLVEGSDFQEIFPRYSDEFVPNRRGSHGILSGVVPGVMEKPFEEVVFQLRRVGEVSPVIETIYGLHVVRLVQRIEAEQLAFEEVRDQLIAEQIETYLRNEKSRFLANFVSVPMTATQPVVAQLRTRYARAAEGILAPAVDGSEQADAQTTSTD